MDIEELKKYESTGREINRNNFLIDFNNFLKYEFNFYDIPFLLKLFRQYKSFYNTDEFKAELFDLLNQKKYYSKLLLSLLIQYTINYKNDRDKIKNELEQILKKIAFENTSEVFKILYDKVNVNFFDSRRDSDIFYKIVKWGKLLNTNEEFFTCNNCEYLLVPSFKASDIYICSNPKCDDSKFEYYLNHCWACYSEINSMVNQKCEICNWYICIFCNKCEKGGNCRGTVYTPPPLLDINLPEPNTFDNIYSNAINKCRRNNIMFIKNRTNRGTKILDNEEDLIYYLAAYGKHHHVKLMDAFNDIDIFANQNICIIDWGCGQGLGSLAFIEKLIKKNKLYLLKEIKLIEPSELALNIAKNNLQLSLRENLNEIQIICENKVIDKISDNIFDVNKDFVVYNIFSNILDIDFDIEKLISKLKIMKPKSKYFICISPSYKKAKERINYFNSQFASILGYKQIRIKENSLKTEAYDFIKNRVVNKIITRYEVTFKVDN